ncbi:MAG: hypothetical protein ACKVTZ_01255 [Bacteroidia bacterium]
MEANKTNAQAATPTSNRFRKWGILGILMVLLILGAVVFAKIGGFGWMANGVVGCKSEGMRAGSLIKFTKKGWIFKTYEGEVVQKAFSTSTEDHWFFSVDDEKVAQKLDEAMRLGKSQHVSLDYCQKAFKVDWKGETDYFVTKVEFAGN